MRYLFNTRVRPLLLSAFVILSLAARAQQLHFIYIQADDKQLFSVKLSGKYYSSSATGYIILPKLADSTYTLEINFAKNSYPEQHFIVTVAGKDYGFALKNFGDKGWGLFNFQTTSLVMNTTAAPAAIEQANITTNNSAFGNMLADAVNDKSINTLSAEDTVTTINKTTAANSTTLPADIIANTTSNAITPKNKAVQSTDTVNEVAEDTSANTPAFNTTGVIKAEENNGEKGTDLVFIDFNGTHNDTIKAFIPLEKKQPAKKTIPDEQAKTAETDSAANKIDNPFFGQNNRADSTASAAAGQPEMMENNQPSSATATGDNGIANAACTNPISEGDLSKLKKRIVAQTKQDDILLTVKKSMRNKCITTAQVKDLSNLFLNDDSRYGFYDSIYPFVSDYTNYASLSSTLIDPYYKNRFKALLH